MSDSRKRRGSAALPSYMRYARPRHNPADQGSLVKAITAAVVLAVAFATGVADTLQAPKVRTTINGARRLDWEEHMDDLENAKPSCVIIECPKRRLVQLEKNANMVVCTTVHVITTAVPQLCCDDVALYSNMDHT